MNKKRWWSLAIFVVLLVVWASTANRVQEVEPTGFMAYLNNTENQLYKTQIYREGAGKTLALIKLTGIISENTVDTPGISSSGYNHRGFLKQLEAAFSQPDVKGIVLQVNSPGGGVYESDEIYNKLMELKVKYHKPLVVYMSQEAASGGYYISMAADRIYANRNTLTGSIGVIMRTYNYQELAEKVGIQDVIFKSGANKDLLNPMRPLSEQEKAIVQNLVNESYGFFVDIVAKGRNMERSQVLELADGRIYSGTQAKNLGLVDELGNLDQAIAGAASLVDTQDPKVLLYENKTPDFLNWLTSVQTPSFDLLDIKQDMEQELGPELLYLAY